MDRPFEIFRVTARDTKKLAEIPKSPHTHDHEQLIVGTEGQIEHFIDFKSIKVKSPYISFITKGKLHRARPIFTNRKFSFWVIYFSTEFIPETTFRLYSYFHDYANIEMKEDGRFSGMVKLCEMMNDEIKQSTPSLAVLRNLLKTLFAMIEEEREKPISGKQLVPNAHNSIFNDFLKILEEYFRRNETVEFYSKKLFMSSRNLNLVCQNILRKSASDIIITRKLIEAKNLLVYSTKTISEISHELGYNEISYFTYIFKKKTGKNPTEYRNEMSKLLS